MKLLNDVVKISSDHAAPLESDATIRRFEPDEIVWLVRTHPGPCAPRGLKPRSRQHPIHLLEQDQLCERARQGPRIIEPARHTRGAKRQDSERPLEINAQMRGEIKARERRPVELRGAFRSWKQRMRPVGSGMPVSLSRVSK